MVCYGISGVVNSNPNSKSSKFMSILYHDSKHPFVRRKNSEEISSFDPKGKFNFLEIIRQIALPQKQNFILLFSSNPKVIEVNLLENNLRWLLPTTVFFFESIRNLTIFGITVRKRHFKFRVKS